MPSWASLFSPRPSQGYTSSRAVNGTPATYSRTRGEAHGSYDQEVERQRKIIQEAESRLEYCKHDLIRVREQLRRKDELYAQLQAKAAASEDIHRQQTTTLCNKINALENDIETVDEEELIRKWRRLRLNVDQWVKKNFKEIAKLGHLDQGAILDYIGVPENNTKTLLGGSMHQTWAIIQALIVKILNDNIFSQYHPGFGEYESNFFFELDRLVAEQCNLNTWRHCKSGINSALAHIMEPEESILFRRLVNQVDHSLGAYASTVPGIWQQQLEAIFKQCAEFKSKCSRQPQTYRFVSSSYGHIIDLNCMTSAAGMTDCSDNRVAISLWQSLWNKSQSGELYCLEPELIWTTIP